MRRINRHRLTTTAKMVDLFKSITDADGMFYLDADLVGRAINVTKRSVLELTSSLIGSGVLERVTIKPKGTRPRWKYKLTGKPLDRRYIEVDKSGELRVFSSTAPPLILSTPPPPRTVRTLTAAICGDPPPGYVRR